MSDVSFAREQLRVLLLEGIHPNAVEVFERAGYTNVAVDLTTDPDPTRENGGPAGGLRDEIATPVVRGVTEEEAARVEHAGEHIIDVEIFFSNPRLAISR